MTSSNKETRIPQNFEIRDGKIIKNGRELPPRKGITPIPKMPKIRKNS